MTRKKSILGVLCVSALAICALAAFGAPGASAAGWTAHECQAAGNGGTGIFYEDSHCEVENQLSGTFETVPLPVGEPVPVTATGTSNFTLFAIVGGVEFEITCTGLEGPGAKATNEEVGGEMVVHGTGGKSRFTGCGVTKPSGRGCHVEETLETRELTSITNSAGDITYTPATAGPFIVIDVTGCSKAALNGEKPVEGTARSERKTAATQEFNSGSGSALTFGGQAAVFTGKYHFSGPNGGTIGLEQP